MLQNSLVSTYPNQTVCNLRTRKFQQILPVNRDNLRSPFGLWSSKPHRLLQLHTSIASPLPMSLRYPYLISRQTLSILVVATFVIIVSHQRAQRGLGGIRWWLLVRVVTIWRLLLLGAGLASASTFAFLACGFTEIITFFRSAGWLLFVGGLGLLSSGLETVGVSSSWTILDRAATASWKLRSCSASSLATCCSYSLLECTEATWNKELRCCK